MGQSVSRVTPVLILDAVSAVVTLGSKVEAVRRRYTELADHGTNQHRRHRRTDRRTRRPRVAAGVDGSLPVEGKESQVGERVG